MNRLKFHPGFIPDIIAGRKTQTRRPIHPQPAGEIADELIECPWPPGVYVVNDSLSVEVKSVRVERLQSISEKDACADGGFSRLTRDYKKPQFTVLWEAFYGNSEFSWVNNPWVWVLEFREGNRAAAEKEG